MPDFDPSTVAIPIGHYIGGMHLAPTSDRLAVLRPSDLEAYAELPVADAETVDHAVRHAERAIRVSGWATRSPRERARAMHRWADLIDARAEELGRLEAVGSTRPIAQAVTGDVGSTSEAIRFFAEWADKLGGEVAATRDDHLGLIINEPYGVVGAITPWNFPLAMASWKVGPALAAGNAIVLKPSELTPFSTVRLAELAVEAGIPPGILNVVQGTGAVTGEALVRHPGIGKVSFTGSTRTGAAIMTAIAGAGIRPMTLELGGKSPQLVFADAPDLEKVADCVAGSLLSNAGQACVAGSRLIVQRGVGARLVEAIAARLARAVPGLTWEARTTYPPIISRLQAERVDAVVARSLADGAELLLGGGFYADQKGAFYRPTLLAGVDSANAAVREEIFGPVLTIQEFEDEAEGIALADHPSYGLAAGVYTSDLGRSLRAVRRLQAGTVWVNRYGRTADFILPTGGFKRSGIGKDLGRDAVLANTRSKSVLIDVSS